MNNATRSSLVVVLFSLGAGNAAAQDPSGFYALAGLGATSNSVQAQDFSTPLALVANQNPTLSKSNSTYRLGGGYRINQRFAAELSYGTLGEFSHKAQNAAPAGNAYQMDSKPAAIQAAVLGFVPLNDQWEVFGRLGLARTQGNLKYPRNEVSAGVPIVRGQPASMSDTAPVIGMGLNFAASGKWFVRTEFEVYSKYKVASVTDMRSTLGAAAQSGGTVSNRSISYLVAVGYKF